MNFQVGDKVFRKTGQQYANYVYPGVIEQLSDAGQAHVRWEADPNDRRPNFHSRISVKSLLPYTREEYEARQVHLQAARANQVAWDARYSQEVPAVSRLPLDC